MPGQDRDAWRSYDSVADVYVRVRSVRNAMLARDLVAAVAPPFGGRILDVGAGTGVAADAAALATGAEGIVVAVDPSVRMLQAGRNPRVRRAAAAAPGLPFPSDTFHRVVGNLVLAHFPDYTTALADLVRVLSPGGRAGLTTWGSLGDAPPVDDRDERTIYEIWAEVASEFVPLDELDEAARAGAPWEDRFQDPANVRAALAVAGLHHIELTERAYRYRLSLDDWLTGQDTTYRSRYLRQRVGNDDWDRFHERVRAALHERAPDPVDLVDQALFAVGTKTGRAQPRR
jgi:SAM-dependent methyltransferase